MLHAEIGNLLRGRETARGKKEPSGFGGKTMMDIKYGKWRIGREMKNRQGNEESITRVGNKNKVVKAEGTESLVRVRYGQTAVGAGKCRIDETRGI